MEATKVQFLVHESGDVFAFFPTQDHDSKGIFKNCFDGEHSGCSTTYAEECRDAFYNEYAHLKTALEAQGYLLQLQKRGDFAANLLKATI
jgi:hypothetical protein